MSEFFEDRERERQSRELRDLLKAITGLAHEATKFLKNFGQKPKGQAVFRFGHPIDKQSNVSADYDKYANHE